MRVRVLALAAASSLAALMLPTQARAVDEPVCDPQSVAAVSFSGLPERLVQQRDYRFSVSETFDGYGLLDGDVSVTLSAAGTSFWSGSVDPLYDPALHVWAGREDGPITVEARYLESTFDVDAPYDACMRVISRVVDSVEGWPMPRPKVGARFEAANFRLRSPAGCRRDYAPTPILLSVRLRHTSRWTTVAASDQCAGWDGGARASRFALRVESAQHLAFVPRTPRRTAIHFFDFSLERAAWKGERLFATRELRRGLITVFTRHYPARRVYAWNGTQLNDEYWNYCVNEGKPVWLHNGNAYCIDPALTYREVSLA